MLNVFFILVLVYGIIYVVFDFILNFDMVYYVLLLYFFNWDFFKVIVIMIVGKFIIFKKNKMLIRKIKGCFVLINNLFCL